MRLSWSATIIHLLYFNVGVNGQASSTNLTITFSSDGLEDCVTRDSSDGITFTTASIPPPQTSICWNLDELFAPNTSQTNGSLSRNNIGGDISNVQWSLVNRESYRSGMNYSRIWYQQVNRTGDGEVGSGLDASRRINIYSGRDCLQTGRDDATLGVQPWVGWSCQSDPDGQCFRAPYNILSFTFRSVDDDGQCLNAAFNGKASGRIAALGSDLLMAIAGLTLLAVEAL